MNDQGKVSINFFNNTSSNSPLARMIKGLALELGKFYHMADNEAIEYFVHSTGQPDFVAWVEDKYGIKLMPYSFQDKNRVYAYGFVMDESEALTAALLRYEERK